ncbi:hypothetical protein FRC06_002934 [Ceratobasidium sp. 370]|nr:hypothetical protein FRC06_002934 [Ceratobasidium sp. 370]
MSTATLHKHRVIIASLFLPTTINFDPDVALRASLVRGKDAMLAAAAPSSDEDAQNPNNITLSSPASPTVPSNPPKPPPRARFDVRLKSIVDDLTLRVESGTPVQTPAAESTPNPFSSFSALASAFISSAGPVTPPRPSRLAPPPTRTRRLSRSSSRIRSSSGTQGGASSPPLVDFTLELRGINLDSTSCEVAIFPIGIDVISLAEKRRDPSVTEWVDVLKERYAGMRMIVGRDKLDEVQGVRQKLLAFEMFLEKYPEFQGRVVLIQVALATTEENEHQVAVFDVVSRINSRFSTLTYQPIVFLHTQDLTFSQYLALLTAADAFFVASLREGMALRTHEFVECQEGKKRPSPLILSEFTGTYSYSGFRSCVGVNPWDARQTASAIHTALTMDDEKALDNWKVLHKHVTTQTAQAFVTSFVTRCIRTHMEHQRREFAAVPHIQPANIFANVPDGKRRLIMLDWEGALWSEDPRITWHSGFTPPSAKLEIVRKLLANDRNEVWLLSGMGVQGGLEKIAAELPGVGLVAENGCMIKPPGQSEWVNMIPNFNLDWKVPAVEILQYYTDRTPGTFIEKRGASLCWRFGNEKRDEAAQQWVRRSAAEAQNHIWDSLGENYGLRIIPGQSSFLILPKNVSRSTAVGTILSPGGLSASKSSEIASLLSPVSAPLTLASSQASHEMFGAILYIGADEHLIRRLNELPNAETCAAGGRATFAQWRVDTAELGELLAAFSA